MADGTFSAEVFANVAACTKEMDPSALDMDHPDTSKICQFYKKLIGECYSKCYCEDAARKKVMEDEIATLEGAPYNCEKFEICSAAAGLRASAFAVFVAAAATLVAAR